MFYIYAYINMNYSLVVMFYGKCSSVGIGCTITKHKTGITYRIGFYDCV